MSDDSDPTLLMLGIIFGTIGLFVAAALGTYAYAARQAAAEGRSLGPPRKKVGAKKQKRMVRARGLQIPTD